MTNVGFIRFDEIPLKGRHLKEIPKEQAAMLSLLLCAQNEANILMRLIIVNSVEAREPTVVQSYVLSTQLFLARTLSSKLFEVVELVKGLKAWQKSDDPKILKFREKSLSSFDKISSGEGYKIARALRDDCTNHYSLKSTAKNASTVSDDEDLTWYMHKMDGNSLALAGEKVVFQERFKENRLPGLSTTEHDPFDLWHNWIISATNWLKVCTAEFALSVIPNNILRDTKRHQVYWPDRTRFAEIEEATLPTFLYERQ